MYTVNFNISGDLHVHIGDLDFERLLSDDMDDMYEDEGDDAEVEFEDYESDIPGLIVSVQGLPADVNREHVESIMAEFIDLLNNEVSEAMYRRRDAAHERI